tara:strand:+ start:15369 stop:17414 length:2046 start_codon:yes stop_codon:yes gene_type:complete
MNKLLINYIRQYLTETTIPFSGSEITANLQHELSPKLKKDMTHIKDPKEVLRILMKNLGNKTCISFVYPYEDDQGNKETPYFSVNPHAAYQTPHGNYSYPLRHENLRELMRRGSVRGTRFAINRPYFLLYKVNSPNTVIINKDGSSNYKEILSNRAYNKKLTRYDDLSTENDIDRVIKSFAHFISTGYYTKKSGKNFNSKSFKTAFMKYQSFLNKEFQNLLTGKISPPTEYINSEGWDASPEVLHSFFDIINKSPEVSDFKEFVLQRDIPRPELTKIISFLENLIRKNIKDLDSSFNKFLKKSLESEDIVYDDFHRIYFVCWFLSKTAQALLNRENNGTIFAAFLKEVGIDGIIDHESSSLHTSEPEQGVLINFGNIDAKDVEFLGTFNNIFLQHSRDKLMDLAAEIYEEEGYKFETDFFSPDEHPYYRYSSQPSYAHAEPDFNWEDENTFIGSKNIKIIDDTFKLLDQMGMITYHDELTQVNEYTASYEIDIHTDMSDSQFNHLIELVEIKINNAISILAEEISEGVKISHPFVQSKKGGSQNIGEFLKKFYYNKYSKGFKYNSPFSSMLQNNLVNDPIYLSDHTTGILVYDKDFVDKTRVEEIILNNCGGNFTIVVNDITYLEILILDKVLTIKSNSSITLDISNIYKQDKYSESDMLQVQEIVDKIKSEFLNIKVKIS